VRGFRRYDRQGDEDNATVLITMSDGLPVLVKGTRHKPRGHDFHLEVFGSEDSISVGDDSVSQPRPAEPDTPMPHKGPYGDFIERFEDCLYQETVAFTEFVGGGCANPCPPESSLEALRVAIACEVSDRGGRPVRVPEIREDPPRLPLGGVMAEQAGGFRPPYE
jgi:Predicted dehydrogenases and related proteins